MNKSESQKSVVHVNVLMFLQTLRESHPSQVDIFTNGSCYHLYRILRSVFSEVNLQDNEVEAYYNSDHVISRINDKFYDITGEVDQGKYLPLVKCFPPEGQVKAIRELMAHEPIELTIDPNDRTTEEWLEWLKRYRIVKTTTGGPVIWFSSKFEKTANEILNSPEYKDSEYNIMKENHPEWFVK